MASPFSIFRKNQKLLLVVFGVLIMFVFTVGAIIQQYQGSMQGGMREDVVAVSWKGGKITNTELETMRFMHNLSAHFLDVVMEKTRENKGTPKVPAIGRSSSDEDLVRTVVLAERAKEMGIVVSDEAIYSYLEQLSDDTIPRDDFVGILYQATNNRIGKAELFDVLRNQLLAQNALMLAGSGITATPPDVAFDYYNRLHRRVVAELVPLKVADYLRVTKEPTPDAIQDLYDKYKNNYPHPSLPEPGFKQRRTIAFEYLKVEYDQFLQEEMAKITPQQIEQEYQQRIAKGEFKIPELPEPSSADSTPEKPEVKTGEPQPPASDSSPAAKPDDRPESATEANQDGPPKDDEAAKPRDENKPSDEAPKPDGSKPTESSQPNKETPKPADETPEPADGDAPKPADQGQKPADEGQKPADESGSDDKKSDETPVVDAPDEEVAKEAEEKPTGDETPPEQTPGQSDSDDDKSASLLGREFFVQAVDESAGSDAEGQSEPAGDSTVSKPNADSASGADAEAEDKGEPKSESDEQTGTSTTPAGQAETEKAEPMKEEPAAKPDETPKFKPLEDVADEIRRALAGQPAQARMEEAIKAAEHQLRDYFIKFKRWESLSQTNPNQLKPAPLDAESLAKKLHVSVGKTPLVDQIEIEQYDLGRSYDFSFADGQIRTIPFGELAYQEGIQLYSAGRIRSGMTSDVEFVYWKTKETDAVVPKLDEIKDEVVTAWKMREALKFAKEDAAKRAEQVRKSGKPLKEVFNDGKQQVVETNEFTWMTRGATPFGSAGMPVLSQVNGAEMAGPDFMEGVFSLRAGEVGVAVNNPETIVYVVRVMSESPPAATLREMFLASGITSDVVSIARMEQARIYSDWYQSLEEEMDVKWLREPESATRF